MCVTVIMRAPAMASDHNLLRVNKIKVKDLKGTGDGSYVVRCSVCMTRGAWWDFPDVLMMSFGSDLARSYVWSVHRERKPGRRHILDMLLR